MGNPITFLFSSNWPKSLYEAQISRIFLFIHWKSFGILFRHAFHDCGAKFATRDTVQEREMGMLLGSNLHYQVLLLDYRPSVVCLHYCSGSNKWMPSQDMERCIALLVNTYHSTQTFLFLACQAVGITLQLSWPSLN